MSDTIAPKMATLLQNTNPQEEKTSFESVRKPYEAVDLMLKSFEPVKEFFSKEHTTEVFFEPNYYKQALSGETASAQRLHQVLSKYLTCHDAKDRTVFRQQLNTAYWEFVKSLVPKMSNIRTPQSKRMVLRYGVVLPSLFTPEQKELFSTAIVKNTSGEPVYYLDEWFRDIGAGHLNISATDEARPTKKATPGSPEEQNRLRQLKSKNAGKLQSAENYLAMKENERNMLEAEIKSRMEILFDHATIPGCDPHKAPFTDSQKRLFSEITEKLRSLQKNDKELSKYLKEYQDSKETCSSLDQKISSGGPVVAEANEEDLMTEVMTIRQMAKMTCGRQGNHFPIFTREFYHCMPRTTGFRENIIDLLSWIESVDTQAFCRIHKNVQNRIVPFVILVPTYGDNGICWEPFERYNRVTSRGRIIVPMYTKNLKKALITAVADLRWQVAKEKASYYWMEEGLTGQYYQYYVSNKLKGDIKDYFVADYILWMTKESTGVQKLDKEVRGIFWRNMPFAKELKEELSKRSMVYMELCQKDKNRALSDGY